MLKLIALDEEDLQVISAHVQDGVVRISDIAWRGKEKRFALAFNRFAWEAEGAVAGEGERHNAILRFDRVVQVSSTGIDRAKPENILSLLAIGFTPAPEAPSGTVELIFSGDAAIRLSVECIEAELADLGGAWQALARPRHEV